MIRSNRHQLILAVEPSTFLLACARLLGLFHSVFFMLERHRVIITGIYHQILPAMLAFTNLQFDSLAIGHNRTGGSGSSCITPYYLFRAVWNCLQLNSIH